MLKVTFRRSVSAPPYSTSVGRAAGAVQITAGATNNQPFTGYALDNCGLENGESNTNQLTLHEFVQCYDIVNECDEVHQ